MSAASNIFVTPSTSLVLIRNVSTPTFVYLSSFATPNFNVTIRDTTGLPIIQTSSIYISTTGNAKFLDGTSVYILNKPYGLVNVGFRNSSFWQILHTSGQPPATAAANVTTLGVSTAFFSLVSSASKVVSSLTIGNLLTTNNLNILSPFTIANLSAPGIVVVESTLNVYGNVTIDNRLFVSGATTIEGSLNVGTLLPLSSVTRVLSSVGVGNSLSVGKGVFVLSTLNTLSTNSIQSLQVQKSTGMTTFEANQLQVQDLVSSFSSLTIQNLFVTLGNLQIGQTISSLSDSVSTTSLDVRGDLFSRCNVSTLGNGVFLNTLDILSTLRVTNDIAISTNLFIQKDLYTSSFSTQSISTLGSLSTSLLQLTSTASISSGLSTANLQGFGWISIGSYFYTPAVVSSLTQTNVLGDINVLEGAAFGSAHISSSIGIGNNLNVRGDSYLGSALFQGVLSTGKSFTSYGYTEVDGSVGVRSNVFVNSNVIIQDFSEISSFAVNSFLLSNLDIMTSSPFLAFTASTLTASTLQTSFTNIGITNPSFLLRFSTFASTTQFNYATAENVRLNDVVTSNFFWGTRPTTLDLASQPRFVFNAESSYPEGFSTLHLQGVLIDADKIDATFLGNGFNISNIAVPFAHVSGITTFASTISTTFLNTSSLLVSTFFNSFLTNAFSSFQSPSFVIEGVGYPLRSDVNQLLVLPRSASDRFVVNQKLFFNPGFVNVGYNISTPSIGGLDISGIFATSNIFFSSINPLNLYTSNTTFISTIFTSSTLVRDSLRFATNGIDIYSSNSFNGDTYPFKIQVTENTTDWYGIFGYISSISLNSRIHVFNNTNRVIVNGLSSGVITQPVYDLVVLNTIASSNGFFSEVNTTGYVQTQSLRSPSLFVNEPTPFLTNSISSSAGTLYFNSSLMTLKSLTGPFFGVNNVSPTANLDVNGNAYFSSVTFAGVPQAKFLRLGSELL